MELLTLIESLLRNVVLFAEHASGLKLRSYQQQVATCITQSILYHKGLTFVVMFPRQSGKNELQAQIECYLLSLMSNFNAEIVKVSPTWKPQSLNAMRRLERVLKKNLIARTLWKKEQGYIYKVGEARIFFLSGSPEANIVGATASTLLECDEAQDVLISKWDKDCNPMAASTNATRVFWGTSWTSHTLLAREKRAALEAQKLDGDQRVFILTADEVRKEVPAYGKFVDSEIAKLGRNHPFVRTQFYSEEIDAEGGMFTPARLQLMLGQHERQTKPDPNQLIVFTLDLAGEDEGATLEPGEQASLLNTQRDSTSLTIFNVDLSALDDPLIKQPIYRIVDRRTWIGTKHTLLYSQLNSLAEVWQPQWIVVDATGVGAGMASFLEKSLPGKIVPFIFTSSSKSKLGWDFLALIETGRFKDWRTEYSQSQDNRKYRDESVIFREQCTACQMEIVPGPGRIMRWSVPDGTRDTATGELIHDDLVLSAALVSLLEEQPWGVAKSEIIHSVDPLADMSEVY